MDITKFCAEEEPPRHRYPIATPWVYDGWRYATDRRIMVREKTDAPDDRPGYPEVPERFAIFEKRDAGALSLIPPLDGEVTEWAEPACQHGPEETANCEKFNECDAAHDSECTNKVKGTTPKTQHFASYRWGGQYIELIHAELPGARYALDMGGFMHFYCGDVEGILARLK